MPKKVSNWIGPKLVLVVLEDEDKGIEVGSDTGEVGRIRAGIQIL